METSTGVGDTGDEERDGLSVGGDIANETLEPSNPEIKNKTSKTLPDTILNLNTATDITKDNVGNEIDNINGTQKSSVVLENNTISKSDDKPVNLEVFDKTSNQNDAPNTTTSSDNIDDENKDASSKLNPDNTSNQNKACNNTASLDKVDAAEKDTPEILQCDKTSQENEVPNTTTLSNKSDAAAKTSSNTCDSKTSQETAPNINPPSDKEDTGEKHTPSDLTCDNKSQENEAVVAASADEKDTPDIHEDDDVVTEVKSEILTVEIKDDHEDMEQLYMKFAYKGERKRKKTARFVAEPFVANPKAPSASKVPEKKPKIPRVDEKMCQVCKIVFDTKKLRFNHELREHGEKRTVFKCMQCNTHCETNQQLRDHKECHKDDTFFCQECELAYDNHCDYLTHSIRHYGNSDSYTCEECQKVLFDKKALKSHARTHYNLHVRCTICNEDVLRPQMTQHKLKHEEIECVECGKICKGQGQHTYHMNVHIGFKPYQCLYCGKGFQSSSGRKVHTDIHLGVRKYQCDICNHESRQLVDLHRHKESHKEKQFECTYCLKKFLHKQSLQQHMRLHTGDHILKCPECSQGFQTKTCLKSHIVHVHTREYNFRCEACDLALLTKNALTRHYKSRKHKQKAYAFNNKKN